MDTSKVLLAYSQTLFHARRRGNTGPVQFEFWDELTQTHCDRFLVLVDRVMTQLAIAVRTPSASLLYFIHDVQLTIEQYSYLGT